MTPINTGGWMRWQYINNYFWQDLNDMVWVSVGWLILPEDRYVWPEFYDRCQIYRNVVWGRLSYWQSNERLEERLMLRLNGEVRLTFSFFDKWYWGYLLSCVGQKWEKFGREVTVTSVKLDGVIKKSKILWRGGNCWRALINVMVLGE